MELELEVVLSSSIKRKKPWPRFCWLGQEKESVFLLDDKRISEINMVSGRTKKRTPKLHPFLNSVVTMASSHNGMWLCGLLVSGELFLWNRDKDLLKTAAAVPEVVHMITAFQGNATRLSLQVSGDGTRVLLVAITGQVFLWECMDVRDLTGLRDGTVKGHWAHIQPLEDTVLPSSQDKEACQHTIFVKTEAVGDACLSAFVFTCGKKLILTCLKIQWEEGNVRVGSVGYSIRWATKTYPMSRLTPACQPVKSRGALVPAFSPDGRLLAIALNQRQPKATQVLFVSTQNFVSVSSGLGGCGSKNLEIPSKYIRSYWVGSVNWSPGGLFLACVLKRGSLLMLARLGGLLTLTSSGCNVDFGPAHFLPLHPLVTYRPPMSAGKGEASLSSSSMSVRDVLRQRYSVTWHPRLLYLIVSDGYMATVLRVLDRPSPALLLKTLLRDTSKDLEKASRILDKSQVLNQILEAVIHVRAWLESVSCLNLDSSLEEFKPVVTRLPNNTDSVISAATDRSTLPLFLQDQGALGGTKELLEKVQSFFEDDSDVDGPPVGSHVEDGGRLEFASMFDTLHALEINTGLVPSPDHEKDFAETERKTPLLHRELGKIQSRLLTAWAFSMSLGNTVENKSCLLKHTLYCVVRFAALLHLIPGSTVNTGKRNTSVSTCLLHLLKALLSFLPWDSAHSDGPCCLGLVVELSKRLVHLLLGPQPEFYQTGHCQLSSHSLSTALLILQLVSDSLDHTYSLQQRTVWSSAENQPLHHWPSDVHCVPLLQNEKEEVSNFVYQAQPVPQRPSSRMLGVWQWVYEITQQYMEELKGFEGCDGWEEEQQQLSCIMSQIQTALQATGERLEEGPALLSYPGCDRSVFQETRLCLALLYSLLFQYHLREAQELGDHMARLILHRAGHQEDSTTCMTADSYPCPWLPMDLHSDTACAVVQTLGRFMAAYFTNQRLYILPPHNVGVLPPLHLPHAPSVGRLVPLCQEEVARAIRRQQLSEVWTVDYAQDLLLLGGLLPEAVWLAYHLGDWKTAASLSLAYTSYCSDHFDFTRFRRRELHLPTVLEPESIFQAELECLFGSKADSQEGKDEDIEKSFTDPLEGEDWDLLQVSIQEILKASVMAGVNVTSSPLSSLLDTAKDLCSGLPALVPNGLYLPSPPLYCPQPSPNTQDPIGTLGQFAEVASRHKVSGVLQRLLLLLRSAHCCHPAAQWYISHLRRARHLLHKIKKKYSYPSAAEEEKPFPEGLMKFVTRSGFFRRGPNKDGHLDPDIIRTIRSCVVYVGCFMSGISSLFPAGSIRPPDSIVEMNRSLVADTLVRAFPKEEESVRVPLREKYNSLLQRLRQCNVLEGEKEEANELMIILLQDKLRQRRKHLGRLQRHLAAPELHLWEKEEEEEDRGSKHGMAMLRQLSLGTSLSTSTLTDCGFPPLCSDGDTAENTSEAVSPEQLSRSINRGKKAKRDRESTKRTVKIERVIQEENHPGDAKENDDQHNVDLPSLPVVGTWEFELEDEEYLNFLELFLSYVLEKDSTDGGDSGSELPLLRSFSSKLRERELHSLTFDVLTTIHRRQRDGHHPARKHWSNDPPVFRAGCCYKPLKQGTTQNSSICSETPISRTSLSVTSLPGLRTGRQNGLFGLQQQSRVPLDQRMKGAYSGSDTSPNQSAFPTGQPSDCLVFGSSTCVETVIELQQGLDPKLEAQFPELSRLLEWMVRWADRKVLLGHHGKKKKAKGDGVGGRADEGVVIRIKASAPAVLTSLSLLEHRYTTLLGTDRYSAHIQIPETQWTVAPVLQPEVDKKLERESSVDTGYPGSANTPVTGLDHNVQQEELSILSHSPARSLKAPPHPEPEALPIVQPEAAVPAQLSESAGVLLPNALEDPPSLQPQSSTTSAPNVLPTVPNQPSSAPPMRQRLGEDLYRLVQHINYMSLMEVLGESFSNLQLAQQNSSLAQSNMNSSHPNVPSSYPTNFTPQPNALLVQTTISGTPQTQACVPRSESSNPQFSQAPACMFADQPAIQSSGKPSPTGDQCNSTRNLPSISNGAGVNYQPADEPVNDEPAAAEEITPRQDFAIQLGSFDSLLTGQRLLDKAVSTAAELHAFASTCKRPPECHDAFTNTDPVCPPTLVDKAVSAQASVTDSGPKSQRSENHQFHKEPPVQDTVETSQAPEHNLDLHGRHFLSVLDLEDEMQHQDLPSSLIQGTQDVPSIPSSPTSAQLHVLATSVIRSATPATDAQPSLTIPEDILKPSTHPDTLEGPSSHSYIEPNWDPERVAPQDIVDPSDSEICQAIKIPSAGFNNASYTPPTVWFSSRLTELDAQLAALQNIADHLEMDFTNSRMLVNTIEKLTPALAPDVKPAVKKTVRLAVPQEGMKHHPTEEAGISHVWADENLGQTGLSDTAEMLDELVKEGYISLTDLDLSTSQKEHHTRKPEQQQSSWMSQKCVLPEDERRELRIWMRRKQRERLAVYHKQRDSLREMERKPFSTSGTKKSTNKNRASTWRTREEKEKAMLLEQYNQRTREASSLASDFPTSPPTLLGSSQPEGAPMVLTTRSTSAPPPGSLHRTYSVSANDKRSLKFQSGQDQSHLRPWTAEVQGRPSEDHRRRLGLHRPVTFLPKDRLSQVTRRGMLSDTKSHSKPHTASQGEEWQRKMGLNKSPSGGTFVLREGIQREQTRMEEKEERDAENLWEPSSEMIRLLGPEESKSNRVLDGLLDEQDDGATAGVSGMEWLDNLSESAGSSLSKIDWAAIERMVAAEDA
eukprot:superscaffoldBa00000871_g7727